VFGIAHPENPDDVMLEGEGVADDVALQMRRELNAADFMVGQQVGEAVVDEETVFQIEVFDEPRVPDAPGPEPEPGSEAKPEPGVPDADDIDGRRFEDIEIEGIEIEGINIDSVEVGDIEDEEVRSVRRDIEDRIGE